MPLQIPAGYSQANFFWQATGATRPSEVTLGFKEGSPGTAALQAGSVYNLIVAANRPCNAAQMNTSWSFLGVRVMLMTETGPTIGENFVTIAGTLGSAPVPVNTSLLIRKNTASGGRRNRGRMFVPPIALPEANVDQMGTILAATVTTNQNNWGGFLTAMIASDFQPVLFHTESAIPTNITAFAVQTTCATQRRRMRK